MGNRNNSRKGIAIAAIMIVSISAGIAASSITDQNENLNLNIVPLSKTFKNPKMESVIAQIVDASETNQAEVQSFASAHDIGIVDGKISVVLELRDEKASLEEGYGIEIEATYKNLVQALVPISAIKELAKDPAVQYMRLPLRAYPMITSEGVGVINADTLHAMGIKGAGVKIAVIDAGFKNYATNPEIPAANIIEAKSFRADLDIEANEEHGTACAEVALDVAPEAGLYLFNFNTDVEFGNAVDYAISEGVDIISYSIGWVNAGGYDGTGVICDIANNAHANGILFVQSAGNQAERHYEGTYTDTDGNDSHEFGPGDEVLDLGTLPVGTRITLYLSWNDWPTSNQDYDLYLLRKEGGVWNIEASSQNGQTGTQPPTEAIVGDTLAEAYWGVGIAKYSATIDVHFELYSFTNYFPEYNVPSSSLCIPADAAGVMTAGATYWSDDSLESFSSQGPTNDGRTKPDVTAPDGVSNSVYGSFYGTSVSTPHTAGAAALLQGANSSLTADQLQSCLESTAVDLGATGKDNLYGSGRIDVLAAYNECVETVEGDFVDVLSVDSSVFPKIWTHVYVNTSAGRAGELTEDDFEIYEDGVKQTIESFETTGGDVTTKADILFVFDDTGSMYGEIGDMKAKVKDLTDAIEAAGIDARYALVSFKDEPELDQGWTSDASVFKAAVDALSASGGGDTPEDDLDALEMGLGLGFRSGAQKIIIDITDAPTHYKGDGSGYSDYTMSEVATDLISTGVTFIAVSPDSSAANEKKVLAEDVGGLWIDIHAADFAEIIDRIVGVITTAYHIDYTTTNPAEDCTTRTVKVVVHDPVEGEDSDTGKYIAPCVSAGNEVYFDPQESSAPYCSEKEVEIRVNATNFQGGQINLTYDSTCANVTNWAMNTATFPMGVWTHSVGDEWILFTATSGLTGEHLIGTLTIHCVSDEECSTTLDFVTTGTKPSKLFDYPDSSEITGVTWTDGTFECVTGGICGDVVPYPDGDGMINMGDVIRLLNHVSIPSDYPVDSWAGDCKCSGEINMGGVILLLNHVSNPDEFALECC